MKKPRALKPFTELDPLTPAERDQLWTDLHDGLAYDRAARRLGAEHFIVIKRHRLFAWWHRESLRRGLNNQLPHEDRLAETAFLDLLNGCALPWSDLLHARVLRAAFHLTSSEDHTPFQLLAIQRIANNEFHQEIARERLQLEKSRLNLRQRQIEHQIARTAANEDKQTVMQEELDFFREKATSDTADSPEPPSPATSDPSHPSDQPDPSDSPNSSVSELHPAHANPNPSPKPNTVPNRNPIATIAQAIHLHRVTAAPDPNHISRNLKLPLLHRVTYYTHARRIEADRGMNPDLVGRHAAENFKSKLRWCPCGRDLPCPDHGELGPHFFEISPDSGAYLDFLKTLSLPCAPWGEIRQHLQELQDLAAAALPKPAA